MKDPEWASNSHITQQIFDILDIHHPHQLFSLDFPIALSSRSSPKKYFDSHDVLSKIDQEALERLKLATLGQFTTDEQQQQQQQKPGPQQQSPVLCPFPTNHLFLSYQQQILLFGTFFWMDNTINRKLQRPPPQPNNCELLAFQLLTGFNNFDAFIKAYPHPSPIFNCFGAAGIGKSLYHIICFYY